MSAGHAAAQAQRTAEVIGTVHGRPVRRDRLDRRLAALRNGPGAAAPVAQLSFMFWCSSMPLPVKCRP